MKKNEVIFFPNSIIPIHRENEEKKIIPNAH